MPAIVAPALVALIAAQPGLRDGPGAAAPDVGFAAALAALGPTSSRAVVVAPEALAGQQGSTPQPPVAALAQGAPDRTAGPAMANPTSETPTPGAPLTTSPATGGGNAAAKPLDVLSRQAGPAQSFLASGKAICAAPSGADQGQPAPAPAQEPALSSLDDADTASASAVPNQRPTTGPSSKAEVASAEDAQPAVEQGMAIPVMLVASGVAPAAQASAATAAPPAPDPSTARTDTRPAASVVLPRGASVQADAAVAPASDGARADAQTAGVPAPFTPIRQAAAERFGAPARARIASSLGPTGVTGPAPASTTAGEAAQAASRTAETTTLTSAGTPAAPSSPAAQDDPEALAAADTAPASPDAGETPLAPAQPGALSSAQESGTPLETQEARATPATVTALTAEMARQTGQKVSRFEVALNPAGLGRVDVSLQIGARGRLTAALNFDRADSAAELKARAPELVAALRDAGFSLAAGDLSFSQLDAGVTGDGGSHAAGQGFGQAHDHAQARAAGARAFSGAGDLADPVSITHARAARGLDIQV